MKYEILKNFIDKYTNIEYKIGETHDFSEERVLEIRNKEKEKNIKLIKKVTKKRVVE